MDNVLRRLPNKKGVQIPVMMIVILIIAIITLGLIIGFIQFFFTDIDQTVREQLAGVKADLRSNLKEGRSLVDTSFGEKLEVKLGEAKPVAFAIKNTGSNPDGETVCYRAGIQCLKSHDLDGRCTPTQPSNVFVGGLDLEGGAESKTPVTSENQWITSFHEAGDIDVPNFDVLVGEFVVQIQDIPKGSYTTQLVVYKEKGNSACDSIGEGFGDKPWKTFRFTTIVS